jgi:hypothetical protein
MRAEEMLDCINSHKTLVSVLHIHLSASSRAPMLLIPILYKLESGVSTGFHPWMLHMPARSVKQPSRLSPIPPSQPSLLTWFLSDLRFPRSLIVSVSFCEDSSAHVGIHLEDEGCMYLSRNEIVTVTEGKKAREKYQKHKIKLQKRENQTRMDMCSS